MTNPDQTFRDAHCRAVQQIVAGWGFSTAVFAHEQAPAVTAPPAGTLIIQRGEVVGVVVPAECLYPEPLPLREFGSRGALRWSPYLAEGWRS